MALLEITRLQYLNAMNIPVYLNGMSIPLWQSQIVPKTTTSTVETFNAVGSTEILAPDSWEKLRAQVSKCQLCSLCSTRKTTVFGEGNLNANWFFIGEAPGQNEDEQGKPFVGESGQLLTEMLRAMQLTREEVFITNILKCRPPQNRDPHVDEIKHCRAYLDRQLALVRPKIMIAVGRIAAQTLLETTEKIGTLRGKIHTVQNTPMIAIYHPSYLLRTLTEKHKAWQDLQFAMRTFRNLTNSDAV